MPGLAKWNRLGQGCWLDWDSAAGGSCIWKYGSFFSPDKSDRQCVTLLVPVRACAVPQRGLPGKQRRGMYMFQLLQGHASGILVEQPRMLRMPGLAKWNRLGQGCWL